MIRKLSEDVQTHLRTGVSVSSVTQYVEELVLNALDAEASSVAVRVDLHTISIQVVDNGHGIARDPLVHIGQRYHTSKCDILKDDDSLCFYGYRGETLASLCSSSAFIEILTRHKSTDITLSKCFHNGKAMHVTETVSSRPVCGTTVTAKSLFYNFPVRRKTLKPGLELERIHHCMAGLALMWPSVSLSLRDDVPSRVILQTQKCNSTLSTFEMMFGSAIAKSMSEVDLVTKTYHITGYISQESSIRRDLRFVFVNKRMVLRSRIHKIINSVLERYFLQRNAALHDDEYQDMYNLQDSLKLTRQHECSPIYVINIECPLNEYDITFDPGKTLVEFSNWDELTEILTHMLLKFQQKKHCLFHSPGISHTPFVPCISTHQQHACLSPDVLGQSDDPFCSVTECVDEHFFTKLQQRNMTNGIDTHNYINSLFSHTVRRRSDHHLGDLLSEFYPSAVKKSKVCDDGKGNLYPLNKQFSHHYYASKLKRSISHQQLKKDLQLKINSSAGNCTLGGDYFHINLVNSCVSYVSSSTCDVRHSKTNYMCDAFSGCAKFNRLHNELMLSSSPMIISQDPTCNEGTAQSKIRLPHRCTNSWWHTFTGQRNISKDSQPHIISCYSRHNGVVEQSVTFTGLLNTSSRSKCNVYEKPVQDFRDICCCSSAILTDGDDRSDRMQQEINISASTVFSPLLISRFSDGEHLCVDCFQTNICGDKCDGQYGICSILPISAMVVTHGDIRPISTPSTVGYGAQFAYSNPFFSQLMTSINIIDGFVSDNGNQITSEGIIFENLHSTDVKHSITFQDFARFIQDDSRLLFNGGMLTSSISGELPLEKFMKCVDCDYLHDLFSSEISCQHSDKGKSHLFLSLPSQSQNILHQMGCVEPCVDQQKMLLSPAHFNSGCQAPIFSMHPECKVQCHSLTRFNNSSCYRRQRQVCNPERGFLPKLNNLNVCGYFDHIFWNLGPNTVLNKTQHFETENYQHMLFETRDTVFMANTMKGVQKMDIFDMCILDNESGQSLRKVSRNEGQEKRHSDANLGILASSARRLEFNTVNDLPCCAQAQSKCKVDVCLNKLTCYNDFVKLKQFRKEGSDKERRRAHSINSYRYTVLREYADCTNNVVLYCRSGGEKCTVTFSNQPSKCSLIEKPDVAECASRYHISESHLSLVFPHHAKQSITFFPQGCHGCLPCPQSSDISVFDGKIMLTVSDVIQTICSFEFSFPSMLCLTCDSDTEFLLKNGNRQQAASSVSDLPQQLHWFEDVRSAKCVIGDVSYHDTKLDWHQHDVHSNVRSILSQVECKQLSAAAHTGDSTSFQCAMLYSRCFDSIVANEIDCSSSLSSDICLTEPCSEINFVEGLPAFKFVTCASNNCFIDNSQCYDRVKSKHCISCQCKTWKECNLLSCGDNHSDMKHASLDEKHIPLFISDDRQIEDCECRVVDKTYNLSFLSRNHRHMYNCFDLSSRNCSLFNSCKFEDKNFCTQQKECTLYRVEKGDVRSCGHVLVNDVDMTHACTYSFISSYGMTDGLAVHYKCAKRSTSFTDTCSLMSSFHSGHIMSWCEDVSASISEADKDRNDITVAQSTVFYCTSATGLTACVSSYAVTLCTANKMNDSGAMLTMNAMFSNGLPDFFCKNMSFLNIKSYKVAHIEDHENKARIDYTSQTLHSCNIAEIAVEQAISSCRDVNKCSDIGFLSDLSCFNSVTEKSVILSSMVNKDVQQCSYIVDSVFNDKYFLPSKNVLASISYENILFKECTFSCEHKPPVEAEFMEISTYSDPKTLSMSIPLKTNMTDQGTPIMTASNTIHMYGETFLSDSKFSQVTDLCEKGASSLHSNTNLWDNGQNEENNCEVVYGKKYDVIIQPEHDVFDNVDWIQFTDPNTGCKLHINNLSGHTITQSQWKRTVVSCHQDVNLAVSSTHSLDEAGSDLVLSHQRDRVVQQCDRVVDHALKAMLSEDFVREMENSPLNCRQCLLSNRTNVAKDVSVTDIISSWHNPVLKKPEVILGMSCIPKFNGNTCCLFPRTSFSKSMLVGAKVIGQIDNKFIACLMHDESKSCVSHESNDLLAIFDQHAVHERIRLEQLLDDVYEKGNSTEARRIARLRIRPAKTMSLSKEDVRLMHSFAAEYDRIGIQFELDMSEPGKVIVHTIPSCVAKRLSHCSGQSFDSNGCCQFLKTLIREHNQLLSATSGASIQLPQQLHRFLASRACKGAIKFGDALSKTSCQDLLRSLSKCSLPFQCAHGRPSLVPLLYISQLDVHRNSKKITFPKLWKLSNMRHIG